MAGDYYLEQPTRPIEINPAHKGKFTEWARRHGFKSTQAAAAHVMANREHYSPDVVRMANFAHNSRGFNHGSREEDRLMGSSQRRHNRGRRGAKRSWSHDNSALDEPNPNDSEEIPDNEDVADDDEMDE